MKTNIPLIEFNPKLPKLSANQKAVLKLLVEAGRLIAPIFLEQEKQLEKDGNFYPKGVSRKEIDKAAKKNPDFLSPYIVVEEVNGHLQAIPYHIKYASFLKPIADILNEAGRITNNKEFGKFLRLQAKALLDGSYEQAVAAWLRMKPYILDISIGPIEHHDDRLFFDKASYQAWVGVVYVKGTKQLNDCKDVILCAKRTALIAEQRFENYNQVRAKVNDVIIFSGHMTRTKFVGVNLPMNINWVKKHGSEVTLFRQVNNLRVQEQIVPTFNKIFSKEFKEGFEYEDLRIGNMSYITLHELAHNDLYYKNAAKNLGDLLSPIYELAATVLGLRMAGSLLLKDMINNKQLESMIIAFICRSFYLVEKSKQDKSWVNYAIGGSVFINFLIRSGALREYRGLAIPNFMKIFISLQDLLYILEQLLSTGTRKDAESFIKEYGQFKKLP